MHSRFYLSIMLISALFILAFTGLAVNRELSNEWHQHQSQYKAIMMKNAKTEIARNRAAGIETGSIRQIFLPSLNKADRCMSCHMGLENPLMVEGELPYKQHSGNFLKTHAVAKFGCTVCHFGQGRATNMKEAHGIGHTFWDYPIIPFEYIQSSCAVCHDYKMLKEEGMHTVVQGERLFREKGCLGCHKLNGVGGDLGAALDGVASRPRLYFPMTNVIGDRTTYNWVRQHFDDPQAIVAGSEMKLTALSEDEANQLTTFMFTLRREEMPSNYKLIKNIATKATDGASLFQKYCSGCHGTGKQSIYDEVLNRTIPAITNPAFLRLIDDFSLKSIVDDGRSGTQMTPWKITTSGLQKEELKEIIGYVAKSRPAQVPGRFDYNKDTINSDNGKTIYEQRCNFCHGDDGKGGGRKLGLNLRNPTVQNVLSFEFLAKTVLYGRKGTPMPSFGPDGEGLSNLEIVDVIAYVKTFGQKKTQ